VAFVDKALGISTVFNRIIVESFKVVLLVVFVLWSHTQNNPQHSPIDHLLFLIRNPLIQVSPQHQCKRIQYCSQVNPKFVGPNNTIAVFNHKLAIGVSITDKG
jgi:hypothetical protein